MAAPMFPVNTHRHDPYRTFKFQIPIDGKPVAGLKKMGALKRKTEAVKWRTAGDPSHERILPGGSSFEPVSLNNIEGDAAMSLKNFRKDIVINVLNLQGQVAISYKLFRAWVSEYQALPEMDAGSMNAVGIQTITLQHEGWQRDGAVSEPTES